MPDTFGSYEGIAVPLLPTNPEGFNPGTVKMTLVPTFVPGVDPIGVVHEDLELAELADPEFQPEPVKCRYCDAPSTGTQGLMSGEPFEVRTLKSGETFVQVIPRETVTGFMPNSMFPVGHMVSTNEVPVCLTHSMWFGSLPIRKVEIPKAVGGAYPYFTAEKRVKAIVDALGYEPKIEEIKVGNRTRYLLHGDSPALKGFKPYGDQPSGDDVTAQLAAAAAKLAAADHANAHKAAVARKVEEAKSALGFE